MIWGFPRLGCTIPRGTTPAGPLSGCRYSPPIATPTVVAKPGSDVALRVQTLRLTPWPSPEAVGGIVCSPRSRTTIAEDGAAPKAPIRRLERARDRQRKKVEPCVKRCALVQPLHLR